MGPADPTRWNITPQKLNTPGTPASREGALAKNSVSVTFEPLFRRAWGVPWLSAGVLGGLRGHRCRIWFISVHCEADLRHKVRCTPCTPTSPEDPNVVFM